MINPDTRLIAIVGPTASGKTALALRLAQAFGGEIVCADSRTIYRHMDIGTAKPTLFEQRLVPHHMLDIIEPDEVLSAAAFKTMAEAAIQDIASRGRVPLLVGGSGLYIDAVLFDYDFPPEADPTLRSQLAGLSDEALRELLAVKDPGAFERVDLANRRRVLRAVETAGAKRSRQFEVSDQMLVLGKLLSKQGTQLRVADRVKKMLEQGFLREVKNIGDTYGWDCEGLNVIGYRAFKDVVLGTKTFAQGEADFVRGDMMLYKKQVTWFRRNPAVQWVESDAEAETIARRFLAQ